MRVFICARLIGRCVNRLYGIYSTDRCRSTVAFYHLTDHSAENPEGYIIRTKFSERVSARKSVSRGAHARICYSHYILQYDNNRYEVSVIITIIIACVV